MKTRHLQLLCAGSLWAISGLALAQTVVFTENFDNAGGDASAGMGSTPPAGWQLRLENAETVSTSGRSKAAKLPWLGWKFVTPTYWSGQFTDGDRKLLTSASGKIAVAESDGLRPDVGQDFNTVMETPLITIQGGQNYTLRFLNHFKMGTTKREHIRVEALFSNGDTQVLLDETAASRLNQSETLHFAAPAAATGVTLRFSYLNTDNNWYWAIDDVQLSERAAVSTQWDLSRLPSGPAPSFLVAPTLQHPGSDRMSVMVETSDTEPSVWLRKMGSTTPFSRVPMQAGSGIFSDATIRLAGLQNLASNTLYEYAVVTGSADAPKVSPLYAFKTWPKAGDGVEQAKFIAIADTQDGRSINGEMIARVIAEHGVMGNECDAADPVSCAENLAGLIISGDLVGSGNSRTQWRDQMFAPLKALTPYVPLIPAPGNHEYFGEASVDVAKSDTWAITYRKYFSHLPNSGSAKHPLHWYALDYLGLKLISVDNNPASAMHNTGSWNTVEYDKGRKLFQASYMQEQLDWFTHTMAQAESQKPSHVVMVNHHPCLSTKWRQGEVLASCDLMSQLESYSQKNDAITASIFGHVHAYERGHSMNSRTLWVNASSASGGLEPATLSDETDLDVFVNTRLDHGYGVLNLRFGDKPQASWTRRSIAGKDNQVSPVDSIHITTDAFANRPTPKVAKQPGVQPDSVSLAFDVAQPEQVYEAQWQLSKSAQFDASQPVYDVWGNDTRREDWSFVGGKRINTQAGVDITTLPLGHILANPKRVYPNLKADQTGSKVMTAIVAGGNSLLDRWSCAYKFDAEGDSADVRGGGRQCYAQLLQADGTKGSVYNPFQGKAPDVLAFGNDERWYWRVRVRDAQLNWSDWSTAGSFELGKPAPEPVEPPTEPEAKDLIAQILPAPAAGLSATDLRVSSTATCAQAQSSASAVPANLLPASLKADTGLVHFALSGCSQPGLSAEVSLTLPSVLPAGAQVMKVHTQADGSQRATPIASATIQGRSVRYTVVDGGELDEDGSKNAAIIDPVLIASPAAVDPTPPVDPVPPVDPKPPVGASATPVPADHPLALLITSLALAGAALAKRRKR